MLRTFWLVFMLVLATAAQSGEIATSETVRAPPDFEYADLLPSLHSVIEFDAVDDMHTRVMISGVGYRDGAGYEALLEFFRQGNAWTFERLQRRFDEGPLEWNTEPPKATPESKTTSNNKRN